MRAQPDPSIVAVCKKFHGLGNRARVVFGAQALARCTGRKLYCVWPVTPAFGARLDDLWQTDVDTIPDWVSRGLAVLYPYRDESLAWMDAAAESRIWQIRTPHALKLPGGASSWERELHSTLPVAQIADRVLNLYRKHLEGHAWIGVMVRAHPVSHRQTLDASPVEWFVDRLLALHASYPDIRFYVSSDTEEAQNRIISAVPGAVGPRDKGDYNSAAGLASAVTDLYLLASSAHLIGPHFSSFPELAIHLAGQSALKLETSRTDPSEMFDPQWATVATDPLRPHKRVALTL